MENEKKKKLGDNMLVQTKREKENAARLGNENGCTRPIASQRRVLSTFYPSSRQELDLGQLGRLDYGVVPLENVAPLRFVVVGTSMLLGITVSGAESVPTPADIGGSKPCFLVTPGATLALFLGLAWRWIQWVDRCIIRL